MAFRLPDRWAVLVGIDLYSRIDPRENLNGCVNDVDQILGVLRLRLRVPDANITILKAPLSSRDNPSSVDERPGLPTRQNVINALRELLTKPPGGFVYFHYSGHGDRFPKYNGSKIPEGRYEVLCTWRKDIVDRELGIILDELAERHTVFVMLDCCHSGGADRRPDGVDDSKIRLRGANNAGANATLNQGIGELASAQQANDRSIVLASPLYRDRKYNLIAACQPNEFAREYGRGLGEGQTALGALTYHFLEVLRKFQPTTLTDTMTYGQLSELISAEFDNPQDMIQHPMHLGDRERILFSAHSGLDSSNQCAIASRVRVSSKRVKLNKGSAHGIAKGDEFRLYNPSAVYLGQVTVDDPNTPVVRISTINDLDSTAVLVPGPPMGVELQWFARLSKRANPRIISVSLPEGNRDRDAYDRIRQGWHLYVIPTSPLELRFEQIPGKADFFVRVEEIDSNEFLRLYDQKRQPIPHLPSIQATGPSNVKQLMGLLTHLFLYQLLLEVGKTHSRLLRPSYEFELRDAPVQGGANDQIGDGSGDENDVEADVEADDGSDDGDGGENDGEPRPIVIGSKRVYFKNCSFRPLYITILNLSPAYGVHQIYPNQAANSHQVECNTEIRNVIIDIEVPPLLEQAYQRSDFEMRDIIKLFITAKPLDLSHYELEDLTQNPAMLETGGTRAKLRLPEMASLVVDTKEIITPERQDSQSKFSERRSRVGNLFSCFC